MDTIIFIVSRARRCDPWGRQCDLNFLVATYFSRLVARLAPMIFLTFFGKTYTNDNPLIG